MRFAFALCLLMILGLTAAAAAEQRQFERWTGACRDDGYCAATAFADPAAGGSPADYVLRIGRHAEETYWELSLTVIAKVPDAGGPFSIAVDDDPENFEGPREVAQYGSGTDFFFMGDGAQAVMDRLMPGRVASISFVDRDGAQQRAAFSLLGLTDALIWIDERQGRIGSERVAEAPPIGLAPVDEEAARFAQVPEALWAQRNTDTDCQPLAELPTAEDIVVDRGIGEGMVLYILPCWAAAHNAGWKAWVEPYEGRYTALPLVEYSPEAGFTATPFLLNYTYDPATKELTTTFLRRTALDFCGETGRYVWQPYDFRLLEFREQVECTEAAGDDREYPMVFPIPARAD